jgi:TonB-dependent receptor
VYRLEPFSVAGVREGNAAAIMKQKNAGNVTNMISMDAYGNVADGNIGNFIQRLPGIDPVKGNGDIQGFNVRGVPMALSTVSLDGAPLSTAYAASSSPTGDRSYQIDNLPAELISSITVTKAPIPSMPADSIGGNVDLVTKSSFELKQRRFSYRVGANYNAYRGTLGWTPTAALTYLDRVGEKSGITVTASFSRSENSYDRVQNTLALAPDGSGQIVNTRLRLIDSVLVRDRSGAGLKFEHGVNDRLVVRLEGTLTYTENESVRHDYRISGVNRIADYSRVSRAAILAGTQARTTSNQTASLAPGFNSTYEELLNATYQYFTTLSPRTNTLYKLSAGADLRLDQGWLRFRASHNPSKSRNIFQNLSSTFSGAKGVVLTDPTSRQPGLAQLYGANMFAGANAASFTGTGVSRQDIEITDLVDNVQIDWRRAFQGDALSGYLQTGASFRHKDFRSLNNTFGYDYTGTGGLANFQISGPGYAMYRGYYPAFDTFDANEANRQLESGSKDFLYRSTNVFRPRTRVRENVEAAYVMANAAYSRLSILGGGRVERTSVNGRGNLTTAGSSSASVTRRDEYTDFFPSLHFRYGITPNLVARASWATSMGRPAISRQTPTTTVDNDVATTIGIGRVTANNVGIQPMYSDNFDLTLEYYFKRLGVISVGAFAKNIDGFINTRRTVIEAGSNNGFNGLYQGYELVTDENLSTAKISGLEFNYSQDLSDMGKLWKGLSLMGNLTCLRSSGQFEDGAAQLPGFKPITANVGVTYKFRRFQTRVLYNYSSGYLGSYSESVTARTYSTEDKSVDLHLQYELGRRLVLFADFNNLFDYSPSSYIINNRNILTFDKNGMRVNVGVSGTF